MTHALPGTAGEASTETLATEHGLVMGTVGYMSPEQVRAQETGHRTDIFSFGAVWSQGDAHFKNRRQPKR